MKLDVKTWMCCGMLSVLLRPMESNAQQMAIERMFNQVRDMFFFNVIGRTGTPRGLKRAAKIKKIQQPIGTDIPFPCNVTGTRSSVRPSTVHKLRPGDIDVIAAMGDSLTAGNGAAATNIFHISTENRGISWSIGGQGTWREYLTLPNILKEFNPRIMGYSLADSLTHHRESQFNVAEIGSMSRDMPYMAKILVKRIRNDKRVDFKNDWKLVTLMIGANDFCVDVCYWSDDRIKRSPEIHKRELMKTLDYLRDNMPRTLVNLVMAPSIKIVHDFKGKSNLCSMTHVLECPCIFGAAREARYEDNIVIQRKWQKSEEEVSYDNRYRKKSDFAVVLQPFIANLHFPEKETKNGNITDFSYLSEDCFHFSQKGYARAANALWNNMLEPIGEKRTDWTDTFSRFLCPTEEHPYFFTHENSRDLPIDVRIT